MNLKQLIFTNSDNYKTRSRITPKGIMVHSTGANNPELRRYVGPDDGLLGKNQYNNHWNQPMSRKVGMHAFIGKLADGSIATYQTLPWEWRAWHSGGKANDTHIGFEICEDGLTNKSYFNSVYLEAVEFTAALCMMFDLDPLKPGVVIGHYEGYKLGLASNHGDPDYWFKRHGKSMDTFREDVATVVRIASAPILFEMEKDLLKDGSEVKKWLGRDGDPFNWCAAQISYAYSKAGLIGKPGYINSTWAYQHAEELQNLGRLYRADDVLDKLVPDALVFKRHDRSNERIDHVAVFKRYNSSKTQMVTIGGNESDWSGSETSPERLVRENYTSLNAPSLFYVGYPPHVKKPEGVAPYTGYLATHRDEIPDPVPDPEVQNPVDGPYINPDGERLWFRAVAGSYTTRGAAEDAVKKLKSEGYRNAWLEAIKVGGWPWFRAHAGSYDRRGPAEAEVQKLISQGYYGAWIQSVYVKPKEG